ncbi:MAG TPA: cyclase family protein [Bacteroidales bacterium]|nr:cyclase family protein [Bacteroidales bacterium]
MKVIDLSHLVTNGMPVYPGTPPVSLKPLASVDSDGFNELQLLITTHIGTHIDCPRHLLNDGFDTTVAADSFYGTGVMINCTYIPGEIPLDYFHDHRKMIGKADFLILYTGWDRNWGKEGYFTGFPVISIECAQFLLEFRLKGIGIDTPSFDPVNSSELPVHNKLLSQGKVLIENLTNLRSLPESGFYFSCMPLKIENGDGCPVRAAGILK